MHVEDNLRYVLIVDLETKRFRVEDRTSLFKQYIGGTGVGIQLLQEFCPSGCDPLGPENPVVLSVGPFCGRFPLASKTTAVFKSPHTGDLGESHCGGRSAVAIRMAGYGAIVIRGASKIPVYLSIHDGRVEFRDASTLWGMASTFTVGRIIRENEPGAGFRTIMRIGRAGENLVSYATVTTESYRHFGRLGLGAVFGSKNLKAILVTGKNPIPPGDIKEHKKLYNEIYTSAVRSSLMRKYHDLGTASNVITLNEIGALPTRNLNSARFDDVEGISGENLAERFLGRRLACAHCPVACIHIAALREPYVDEPYFYKTSMISYDYEPIYAIGSMLGIGDPEEYLRLMDTIEKVGIDVISTGVALAWATEAQERGIASGRLTADLHLKWGDVKTYQRAVEYLVSGYNEFFRDLARGVRHASSKYGGEDFALAFAGNEMPGYHTGPAAYLGYLIGARHGHLDNAGYSLDQKRLVNEKLSPERVVDELVREERWRQILSSLVICFFAREIYQPELVIRGLRLSGIDSTEEAVSRIGAQIHAAKFAFKKREGFSLQEESLPKRIYQTPAPVSFVDHTYLRRGLEYFEQYVLSPAGGENAGSRRHDF
jgi:aldehyde:ferredoxin oxidoreductase